MTLRCDWKRFWLRLREWFVSAIATTASDGRRDARISAVSSSPACRNRCQLQAMDVAEYSTARHTLFDMVTFAWSIMAVERPGKGS